MLVGKLHIDKDKVERMKNTIIELNMESLLKYLPKYEEVDDGVVYEHDLGYFQEFDEYCDLEPFFIDEELSAIYEKEVNKSFSTILEENPKLKKSEYGVCDNIEQAKEYLKEFIEDPDNQYILSWDIVRQHKENAGRGGGWRWHKWGPYIGNLEPQCEYLDDEDFGEDWQGYVLLFHIKKLKRNINGK